MSTRNCFMTWLIDESVLVLFVAWKQMKLRDTLTKLNMIIQFSLTFNTKTIGWKRSVKSNKMHGNYRDQK